MNSLRLLPVIVLFCGCGTISAQYRVDPSQSYERIYAILPMTGKGTLDDPKRPMFMPAPAQMKANDRTGIIAYHQVASDDGRFALVEIVTASRTELAPITSQLKAQAAVTAGLQVFDSGQDRATVERAFKAQRKNFDFSLFKLAVQ